MIQLAGERYFLQEREQILGDCPPIPVGKCELSGALFFGKCVLGRSREYPIDLFAYVPGEKIVAAEIHVHMVVEQVCARCSLGTRLRQPFQVNQRNAIARFGRGDFADDLIDAGISAKSQSIVVPRLNVVLESGRIVVQVLVDTSEPELQVGKLIVNLGGAQVEAQSIVKVAARLGGYSVFV